MFIKWDMYYFQFGKTLCNSSNVSDSRCGSLSFRLGYYFLECCCYERVLETQGTSSEENAVCLQKTRTSGSTRSVASQIWFPVDLHLVVHFKLLLSFFRCLGQLKEDSLRSQLSWEPTGLCPCGSCSIPVRFRPWFLYHQYNDPILSKTNNIIVLVRVDPLHTWLESGEELLDKAGQLHLEINFILSQSVDRFWSQKS